MTATARRRAFDGPWRPHWSRLAAAAAIFGCWALIAAAVFWRPDAATLATIGGVILAAVWIALCLAAAAAIVAGLGLAILDIVVTPLLARRNRSRP